MSRCGTPAEAARHPQADEAGPGLAILLGMKSNGSGTRLHLLSLLLIAACDKESTVPYSGDPESCAPTLLGTPVELALVARSRAATWVETDGELLGIGPL